MEDLMSVPKQDSQASFFDTTFLTQALFDEQNRYELFRREIYPALQGMRDELCQLYCLDNGRPGLEPVLLAGVTLLQFIEKVPDRQAVELLRLNLGWKHALNLRIDDPGFHPTSLVTFRERLMGPQDGRLLFDIILQLVHGKGLVQRRGKQRIDSTHVLAAVARMGRLEVVRETLRLFLEMVQRMRLEGSLPDWSLFHDRYIDCDIAWHKVGKDQLISKHQQAGRDMHRLLQWAGDLPELAGHEKTQLLRRVFDEQYELTEPGPQQRKHEGPGVVKNPHDPDVQWSSKEPNGQKAWEGYKVQIAETVPEGQPSERPKGQPTTGFITEITTTDAIASDFEGRDIVEQRQEEHGLGAADECYVDAGYISDDTLARAEQAGRVLMGPARPSRNSSGELFTADDFEVSVAERRAICPAGHASTQCSRLENAQTSQVNYRFEWSYHCDGCPLQSHCTNARRGRRMLVVGEHHDHLQKRRREMQTAAFQEAMKHRNGIEGTISEFARNGGRRTRYRGLPKTSLCNYLHGAALNIKRLIRLLQYQMSVAAVSV
jgi:hypothetical protein